MQAGNPLTVPCGECLRARPDPNEWRKDPSMGLCGRCGEMLECGTNGELMACVYCASAEQNGGESAADFGVRAHIPRRYSACRLETFEPPSSQVRRAIEHYTETWPPSGPRLLTGPSGSGKTHLAIAALFAFWQRHGKRGRFWPVVELLDRYRATFDEARATETVEAIDAEMRRTPVLVLDDLGTQKSTEWAEERLFRLVDERYRDNSALIVTTNLTVMELPTRVASRVSSGVVLQVRGQDRRAS